MIIFLTLCYCGILALLIWKNVIKLTLAWKISPVIFFLFLLIVLVIPMQWGAPSGTVNIYKGVVEIIPNVSGEVIEVPAKPLVPLKKGDVLFTIDPEPYQAEVDRLEAALVEAEQNAKQLPIELTAKKASVAQAQAALFQAKQQAQALESAYTAADAAVTKSESQSQLASSKFERGKTLVASSAITEEEQETRLRNFESAKATLEAAKASREQAKLALDSKIGGVNTLVLQAEELLAVAQADQAKAQIAVDSIINGENTTVAQLRAQLTAAKLNLDYTTVRAPSDGYLIGLTLRPGQRVAQFPVRGWMTFVDNEYQRVLVSINQNTLRHIKPGQQAETVLKMYPGRTIQGTVESIVDMNSQGQSNPSGNIPETSSFSSEPLGVVLKLEDQTVDLSNLPGGATGTSTIYTDNAKLTHIIRKVELRIQSWLNYVIP